jgi:hypothetical protein
MELLLIIYSQSDDAGYGLLLNSHLSTQITKSTVPPTTDHQSQALLDFKTESLHHLQGSLHSLGCQVSGVPGISTLLRIPSILNLRVHLLHPDLPDP